MQIPTPQEFAAGVLHPPKKGMHVLICKNGRVGWAELKYSQAAHTVDTSGTKWLYALLAGTRVQWFDQAPMS